MIELMKFDMGGAGAVLGAAKALGAIQPPGVEVSVPVPCGAIVPLACFGERWSSLPTLNFRVAATPWWSS